jgi:hypothetical protein
MELTGIAVSRLESLAAGERMPSATELTALATIYVIDSPSLFLSSCQELVERVVAGNGEALARQDEDLFELLDQMVCYLAHRGRL